MPNLYDTREAWLQGAVAELKPIIDNVLATEAHEKASEEVPPVYVSMGFAPTSARKTLGFCCNSECSADGLHHIFLTPTYGSSVTDPQGLLASLLHELCHACMPKGVGHRKPFGMLAEAVGLEGKWTATVAGEALLPRLNDIAEKLGPFPHAACDPFKQGMKKQGTRMKKLECGSCGYVVRTTHKWLEEKGAPICPCNMEPMEQE